MHVTIDKALGAMRNDSMVFDQFSFTHSIIVHEHSDNFVGLDFILQVRDCPQLHSICRLILLDC